METKVILCDGCKKKIAVGNCELCGADICEENKCNHNREVSIYSVTFVNLKLCEKCDDIVYSKIRARDKFETGNLKPFILDLFRKNCIVDTLMKGGNGK